MSAIYVCVCVGGGGGGGAYFDCSMHLCSIVEIVALCAISKPDNNFKNATQKPLLQACD